MRKGKMFRRSVGNAILHDPWTTRFYQNHFLPLRDENIILKEELEKTQTMLMNYKKKNDERFEIIMKHLEGFNRLLSSKQGQ